MSISWWRSWHGAPMDHKWAVIGARADVKPGIVSAIAWALFDHASQAEDRGNVKNFDVETYAVYAGFPILDVEAVIRAMMDKGIIVNGRLANWDKRQPKREDDSNERVRKFRELKRTVTQSNAPEKEEDTEEDKDTDKEKDKKSSAPLTFDEIQVVLETCGVLVNTVDAIKSVNKIVAFGANEDDLRNGIKWKSENTENKIIYASSIVGPTQTAMQKRLKQSNGHKGVKHEFTENYQ
jgi:hypothetical protein